MQRQQPKQSKVQNCVVLKQFSSQQTNNGSRLQFYIKLFKGQMNEKYEKLTLSIEVICESKMSKFHKKLKTSELPSQAITIFYDVENLYDYIEQNFENKQRIKFRPQHNLLTIINVVVMKNKELKQQVELFLIKEDYIPSKIRKVQYSLDQSSILQGLNISQNEQKINSSQLIQSLVKQHNQLMDDKIASLVQHMNVFVSEIAILKKQNVELTKKVNLCNNSVKTLQNENVLMYNKIQKLQKQLKETSNNKQLNHNSLSNIQKISQIQKKVSQNKWNIDQMVYSFQNLKQQHQQLKSSRIKMQSSIIKQQKSDQYMPLIHQLKKEVSHLGSKVVSLKQNSSRLGCKIFISLDFQSNKYLQNFRIVQNIVQKIDGDQQRHQILGLQNINLFSQSKKCHFQIKILSSTNAGVVLGVVSHIRKHQRYSYDKKDCVCYDGKGFIFQQGSKIKMPCKFDHGQTVRVVIDPLQSVIQWFVGYTQIGSTLIPDSMRNIKLVPYIEIYQWMNNIIQSTIR